MKVVSMKKSVLAAAVTSAIALGASGQVAASVYGLSSLSIDDLTIVLAPEAGATTGTFRFTATNTATLNGASDFVTATCGGTTASNTCAAAPPRLNPLPANAPGGTEVRADAVPTAPATLPLLGPGATQYATSDSVIRTAQLTGDPNTETHQIAESELQAGLTASSSALIQSITGFTFTFTIAAPGTLTLSATADPDMLALIGSEPPGSYSASADMNVSFTLTQNTGGTGSASWNPQGTAADDCTESGGVTCVENFDSEDLNINVGTTTPGTFDAHSYEPGAPNFLPYSITVSGLTAGTWTLTLNANTSTDLSRQPQQVAEPGVLALFGIGLAGLGVVVRRRRRA